MAIWHKNLKNKNFGNKETRKKMHVFFELGRVALIIAWLFQSWLVVMKKIEQKAFTRSQKIRKMVSGSSMIKVQTTLQCQDAIKHNWALASPDRPNFSICVCQNLFSDLYIKRIQAIFEHSVAYLTWRSNEEYEQVPNDTKKVWTSIKRYKTPGIFRTTNSISWECIRRMEGGVKARERGKEEKRRE